MRHFERFSNIVKTAIKEVHLRKTFVSWVAWVELASRDEREKSMMKWGGRQGTREAYLKYDCSSIKAIKNKSRKIIASFKGPMASELSSLKRTAYDAHLAHKNRAKLATNSYSTARGYTSLISCSRHFFVRLLDWCEKAKAAAAAASRERMPSELRLTYVCRK